MMTKKTSVKEHTGSELKEMYLQAEECDKGLFAEQRSNILLIAGDHYYSPHAKFSRTIRDHRDLSEQQKIRLTKNHIHKIHETYKNYILGACPGVGFGPHNEKELSDQKSAELAHAVWRDGSERQNFESSMVEDFVDDYLGLGEVAAKLYFDPSIGPIDGYHPQVGEDGNPTLDEVGEMSADMDKPVHRGEIVIEPIHGFNLLRDPNARDMLRSTLQYRKMAKVTDLVKQFNITDPDIVKNIEETRDDTMVVFDSQKGEYSEAAKGQCMVVEYYFRPCARYPRGYFYICVAEKVLSKGELPNGIFPIVFAPCYKIQTSPRGRSPVKTMRPYQVEINRAASKIAEHHITLGDDKLIIQNGSAVTSGVSIPGVRTVSVTGQAPTVMPGRSGDQYLGYMQQQIQEMYQVMGVGELLDDVKNETDVFAMLFKSASQKRRFSRIIGRFEEFLVAITETYLELAKYHLPDDAIIRAIGKSEAVNISEFKNMNSLSYEVKIDPESEDIETKMGKQLAIQQVLQYVGGQLGKEEIGQFVRLMPFLNKEKAFEGLTVNYDMGTNAILALDHGKMPPLSPYQDHEYLINRLTQRQNLGDFELLDPRAKQAYAQYIAQLIQASEEKLRKAAMAKDGLIPTGGYLVTLDFYTTDKDGKTRRARLPYEAVSWLLQRLETQGSTQQSLDTMNKGALAQLGNMIQMKSQPQGMPPQQGQLQLPPDPEPIPGKQALPNM